MAGNENWLEPVSSRLGHICIDFPPHTIFRIPRFLVDEKSKISYHPSIASIGPFHHEDSRLKSMEEHKMRYLLSLMLRDKNPRQLMDSCGNAILGLNEKIRACYAVEITVENNKVAEIMLVDGCFLIELFLRNSEKPEKARGDRLFNSAGMLNALRRNLALLENQIPFFVLKKLFCLTVPSYCSNPLPALKTFVLQLFRWELNLEDDEAFEVRCNGVKPDHMLDFIRHCYVYTFRPKKASNQHDWKSIRSAMALSATGIRFEKSPSKNLLDLEFSNNGGKFKNPQLIIHGWTESLLRNLMALEQCRCDHRESYITSYIFLMDRLIETAQDVIFPEKKQISKGYMREAKAVARLFNNIGKQGVVMDFHFGKLCDDLQNYYRRPWP